MKTLIDPKVTPVGGWRYYDKEIDVHFDRYYRDFHSLITHIQSYRRQNEKDIPIDLKEKVIDWLCSQEGMKNYCCDKKNFSRSFTQSLRGAYAIAKAIAKGAYVSDSVAEKRAKICEKCPYNQYVKSDYRSGFYSDWFVRVATQGRDIVSEKLFTCMQCGCIMPVKIYYDKKEVLDSLDKETKDKMKEEIKPDSDEPFYCWQTKDVF